MKYYFLLCAFALVAQGCRLAQERTETSITFAVELEEQGRAQLRRLLTQYDLDPWMFTNRIKIEAGREPHSMPILTLNTDHLNDDLRQLSIFIHEQAHWHVAAAPGRDAAIEALRARYPDAPVDSDRLYQHLLVAWVELDALAELLGESKARRVISEKVDFLTPDLPPEVARRYRWYNELVLEETDALGAIVAHHGIVITPERGISAN